CGGKQHRVAIRIGSGGHFIADIGAGTSPVLDDGLLAPDFRELLGDDAGDNVGPPAANGTMKRTTRLGQSSDCICTNAARPLRLSAKADPADRAIRRRRVSTRSPWLRLFYPSREHLRKS